MKQILIATHGKMASGIRYTAELIVGELAKITTIDAYVTPEDNVEKQFEEYFSAHREDRIFVFTDLMGGSVNQKLLRYAQQENVTLITGTNLPVLMQIMLADEDVEVEEIRQYIEDARQELQLVEIGKKEEEKPEKAKVEEESVQETFDNSTAKITALRVDDRLIHGQVAMTWTKQLRVQGIVVANDAAAGDNTQKMALKMAVPAGIKVLIKPVDEAIRVLNNPKASSMRILVLTRTVTDALKIRKQVGEIEFLNIGNAGRFDGVDVSEKQILSPTIMLTDEEVKSLRELVEMNPKTNGIKRREKKDVKCISCSTGCVYLCGRCRADRIYDVEPADRHRTVGWIVFGRFTYRCGCRSFPGSSVYGRCQYRRCLGGGARNRHSRRSCFCDYAGQRVGGRVDAGASYRYFGTSDQDGSVYLCCRNVCQDL